MSLWMRINAPHTIGSDTLPSRRVVPVSAAAVFMIHSKFSVKSSAAADLAEVFSRRSSAAVLGGAQTIVVADRIGGTTRKSNLRKLRSAQRRPLRLRSLIPAINATAAALNRARTRSPAQRAAAVVK